MDRKTFRRIVLTTAFKKNSMYDKLIESVSVLKMLSTNDRMNLADSLVTLTYTNGEQIVKQGEESNGIYFILNGIVSVKKSFVGIETEIMKIGKSDHFGELSMVGNQSRQNSFYAASDDVKLAFLDVSTIERVLGGSIINFIK